MESLIKTIDINYRYVILTMGIITPIQNVGKM